MTSALLTIIAIILISTLLFKQYLSIERDKRLKNLMQVRIKFGICSKRIISSLNSVIDLPTWARLKVESRLLALEDSLQTYDDELDQLSAQVQHLLFDMKEFDKELDRLAATAVDLIKKVQDLVGKTKREIEEKMIACGNLKARVDFSLYGINKLCFEEHGNDSNFDAERQRVTELKARLEDIDVNRIAECPKNTDLLNALHSEAKSLLNEVNDKIAFLGYK